MKKRYLRTAIVALIVLISTITFTNCKSKTENIAEYENVTNDSVSTDTSDIFSEKELMDRANLTLQYLKDRDFQKLSTVIHKDKGVMFLPYAHRLVGQRFTVSQLAELKIIDIYEWHKPEGDWDASIDLSVDDYFNVFVYNRDYLQAPQVGIDENFVFNGIIVCNIETVFPNAHRVVYQFPATDRVNWNALNLVFEQADGQWMLIGVVHACYVTY